MKIKLGDLYTNNLIKILHIRRQIIQTIIIFIIQSYLIISILTRIMYFMMFLIMYFIYKLKLIQV